MATIKKENGTGEGGTEKAATLSATARARIERNRLKARALREARLAERPAPALTTNSESPLACALDSGGGFLLEQEVCEPSRAAPPPAPISAPHDRPPCLQCDRPIATSYLLDTFNYPVCDTCKDDEGAHALVTRTEAKSWFLLRDVDIDERGGELPCVRRRNPHRRAAHDMRLYLRAQIEARALEVWGSEEELQAEKARREEKASLTKARTHAKRLRVLRMEARSALYDRSHASHTHDLGPEEYDEDSDTYSRKCNTCPYVNTYEKM